MEQRIINQVSEWTNNELDEVSRVITFRTQNLLDLFVNEIEGQISDGMWENSRGTDWMWKGRTLYLLGDKTEVKYDSYKFWQSRKTTFPLGRELCDVVGERAMIEAGFNSIGEMKAGWKEINDAIKNAIPFNQPERGIYIHTPNRNMDEAKKRFTIELRNKVLSTCETIHIIEVYGGRKFAVKPEVGLKEDCIIGLVSLPDSPSWSGVQIEYNPFNSKGLKYKNVVPVEKVDAVIRALVECEGLGL